MRDGVIVAAQAIVLGVHRGGGRGQHGVDVERAVPAARAARRREDGARPGLDSMIVDGWWDVYSHQHMGQCAELGAREKDITRADPDAFAAESHRRALVAQLPELRPAFDQNGTVTAGNASSINEAFSVVSLVSQRRLDPDPGRVNVHGGAVAIAHPIGGSGTRILVTSLYAMITRGCRAGGASLCSGGDDAITLLVERDAS